MSGAATPLPFGPESRTGFELELLAPRGASRLGLAEALAAAHRGRVLRGFKLLSDALNRQGQVVPCCELVPAFRVLAPSGAPLFTLVDDFSIQAELDFLQLPVAGAWRLVMDEPRLAAWVERTCWAESPDREVLLRPLLDTFSASLGEDGKGPRCRPGQRLIRDPQGEVLAVSVPYGSERERVCEVVTQPLRRDEREAALRLVLQTAQRLGYELPSEAGLHAHLDAGPWQTGARVRALLLGYASHREELLRALAPNPRSALWRGPPPERMVELARSRTPDSFEELAPLLLAAGAAKRQDLNLLGVLRDRHRQPTLELRILPMEWSAEAILEKLRRVEELLGTIARSAAGAP